MTQTLANTNHVARALSLLGSGVSTEQTAIALGVTPSAISQLLADEEFAEQVIALRYENLQSHNKRDGAYDRIEDKLLQKLEKSIGLIIKPEMILKAISTVNAAKRRGQSAPQQVAESANVISLTMPTKIIQHFTTNVHNQVVQAGDQSLHTIESGSLVKSLKEREKERLQQLPPTEETNDSQAEALP